MKTVNIEGVVLNQSSIEMLSAFQEKEQNATLMKHLICLNSFFVDKLSYEDNEENRNFVDYLQTGNLLLQLVQSLKV